MQAQAERNTGAPPPLRDLPLLDPSLPAPEDPNDPYDGDMEIPIVPELGDPDDPVDATPGIPLPSPAGPPPGVFRFPGGYTLKPLPKAKPLAIGGGLPLTLGHVLSSTSRHHPTIVAARRSLQAARGERLAAVGGFDPQLKAVGWATPVGYYQWGRGNVTLTQPTPFWGTEFYAGWRIGRALERDDEAGGIPLYYGNYETLNAGEIRGGVRAPLWRDGPIDERRAELWQAEHALDAATHALRTTMLSVTYDAAKAYWSWVAAGQKYLVVVWLLNLAELRDDQLRMRATSGAIPPVEALENRRAVVSRRKQLIQHRRELERAAIHLSLYLRESDGSPLLPEPERVPTVLKPPEPLNIELAAAIRQTLARHPALERYQALLDRQEVVTDFAESRFSPRIDVKLEASKDLGDGTERQQRIYGEPRLEGAVVLELPLLFRAARGNIQAARARLRELDQNAILARNRVLTGVINAVSAARAAREVYGIAHEAAQVAAALAQAELRRFELGATELFIVNLREQKAAEAAVDLADATAELHLAHAQWRVATATPSDWSDFSAP